MQNKTIKKNNRQRGSEDLGELNTTSAKLCWDVAPGCP